MLIFIYPDVMKAGVWRLFQNIHDPELQNFAHMLPLTVLHSQATSSNKKYLGAFEHWKTWAREHKLSGFPSQPHHVALYLQHLAEMLESKYSAEEAGNALNWVHNLAWVASPTANPFIRPTLEGIQRMLARPTRKQ